MAYFFLHYIQSYNLEFEAIELTKLSKKMNKKKRTVSVDCDIGQILIITVNVNKQCYFEN